MQRSSPSSLLPIRWGSVRRSDGDGSAGGGRRRITVWLVYMACMQHIFSIPLHPLIQRAAKKFFCFAKHDPGSARQYYTQPWAGHFVRQQLMRDIQTGVILFAPACIKNISKKIFTYVTVTFCHGKKESIGGCMNRQNCKFCARGYAGARKGSDGGGQRCQRPRPLHTRAGGRRAALVSFLLFSPFSCFPHSARRRTRGRTDAHADG